MDCRTALLTILDQVDYTNGACGLTEMVGACLPKEVIELARKAIADEKNGQPEGDSEETVKGNPASYIAWKRMAEAAKEFDMREYEYWTGVRWQAISPHTMMLRKRSGV